MKKSTLFLVLILTFSVFVSCSKDNNSENELVIKKVTEEIYPGGQVRTTQETFIYEDNKFVKSISGDGKYVTFTYDGEKVIKINRFSATNEFLSGTNLIYSGDNLVRSEGDSGSSYTLFSYQNGKLIKTEYGYDTSSGFNVQYKNELAYNSNENNIEKLSISAFNQTPSTSKSVIVYDDKNNPTKFMNKYLKLIFETEGFNGLSKNNKISYKYFSPISNATPINYTYQLEYNSDNYPTNIKLLKENGTLVSNTTFEYQSN